MDDRLKAVLYQRPERIPVRVSILPAAWMKYRDELDRVAGHHPDLFPDHRPGQRDYDRVWSPTYHVGDHTDAWGCVWSNCTEGMEAIVTGHPVPNREDVNAFRPPAPGAGLPHGFMFLRLADLRGFEEIMVDFAEEPPELRRLVDLVRDYNVGEARRLAAVPAGENSFARLGDDLGIQHALPVSPEAWRKYLKPAFAAIFGEFKKAGRYVFFHTDGCIWQIMPDLQECGADIINPQVRANGLDRLETVCKGKIPIDLDLDRQLFPFASKGQVDEHIEECVCRLGLPEGGLWLTAEIGPDVEPDIVDAILSSLTRHRDRFRR